MSKRVSIRRGEASKDGGCVACHSRGLVWVILLGPPEGNRLEIRLCDGCLNEVGSQAKALGLAEFTSWLKANSGRAAG